MFLEKNETKLYTLQYKVYISKCEHTDDLATLNIFTAADRKLSEKSE